MAKYAFPLNNFAIKLLEKKKEIHLNTNILSVHPKSNKDRYKQLIKQIETVLISISYISFKKMYVFLSCRICQMRTLAWVSVLKQTSTHWHKWRREGTYFKMTPCSPIERLLSHQSFINSSPTAFEQRYSWCNSYHKKWTW